MGKCWPAPLIEGMHACMYRWMHACVESSCNDILSSEHDQLAVHDQVRREIEMQAYFLPMLTLGCPLSLLSPRPLNEARPLSV